MAPSPAAQVETSLQPQDDMSLTENKNVSSFEQLHQTASGCEDPPQKPEDTAALKEPLSLESQDSYGGFCPTPQKKKGTYKDKEDTLLPPIKRLCFSQEPSNSDGSADQEVQEQRPWFGRLVEESSGDGTVRQEVQDVAVDPLPGAHSAISRTTSGDDVPQGTMEELPDKILQFNSWEELYHQYLKGINHASQTLQFILQCYGLTKEHPQCMLGFIRCASAVWSCHCQDPTAVLTCLKHHSFFPMAEVCIAKRLPDLDDHKEQPTYVRAVIAAIVLLAGGACDIQELVNCLRRPSATMSRTDILEMLYCVATLLYAMRENEVQISNRLHYNVFHCLRHLENSPLNDPELSSSERDLGSDLQLTGEQQEILNHAIAPGKRIKIMGFAGTGKTFTLIQYAKKWSTKKFLYLAFSRSMVNKMSKVKLTNLTCKTIHSFALGKIKEIKEITDMKKYKLGSLTVREVARVLSDPFIAKTVKQTLEAFFASTDESITEKHVLISCKIDPRENVKIIVEEAKQIWSKMKTLDSTQEMAHRMTHDGYVKYLQLRKPSISQDKVIMMDGVEDCTPAIMDIILRQTCGVILVGDPYQQICTFRGADNSGFSVSDSRDFYLTQSFRFGCKIAYVGATLLDSLVLDKKVRNKTLVGNNLKSDVSEVHIEGKVACLSRTNRAIFNNVVEILDKSSSANIHFLGGYGLEIIHDLWKLLHPERGLEITVSFIKAWKEEGKDFMSLKEYAEKTEDKDLERSIAIVEKYPDIPELLKRINSCKVENADYILGTVYKAKGLEFDTVRIDDDFDGYPTDYIPGTVYKAKGLEFDTVRIDDDFDGYPTDKRNLLYVAVTRAKKLLIIPRCLADILKEDKDYYVRFELATAQGNMTPLVCSEGECRNSIPADSLLIRKKMDGTETPEGFLCPSCACSKHGPIAQLAGSSRMDQVVPRLPEGTEVPPGVHFLLEDF